MTYTTADYIYDRVGVTTTDIDTDQMKRILEQVDAEVDRLINTTCIPKTKIELLNGDNKNFLYLRNIPLLSVQALEIDDTTISLDKIRWFEEGKIALLQTAEQQYFYSNVNLKNVRIKYLFGWLEETTTQTANTADEIAGTAQTIAVTTGTGSGFTTGDYIKIHGFDGNEEVTKLTNVASDNLTCDLVLPHEANSLITKLQVPTIVKKLAGAIGAIIGAMHMLGSTYEFATGYTIPDFTVQKGEPYPAFVKVVDEAVKERNQILDVLPRWPVFA